MKGKSQQNNTSFHSICSINTDSSNSTVLKPYNIIIDVIVNYSTDCMLFN